MALIASITAPIAVATALAVAFSSFLIGILNARQSRDKIGCCSRTAPLGCGVLAGRSGRHPGRKLEELRSQALTVAVVGVLPILSIGATMVTSWIAHLL